MRWPVDWGRLLRLLHVWMVNSCMFDDLHIPIPADLSFTPSSIGFDTWWGMWKTHVFRKALGPRLQQIDPEYVILEEEVLNLCIFSFQILYPFLLANPAHPVSSNKMVQNLRPALGSHSTFFQLLLMYSSTKDHHQ